MEEVKNQIIVLNARVCGKKILYFKDSGLYTMTTENLPLDTMKFLAKIFFDSEEAHRELENGILIFMRNPR